MTKANYIDWENLRNIPFFLCQVVEDEQNQEIVLYYLGERVFHDYDHVGVSPTFTTNVTLRLYFHRNIHKLNL